MNDLDPIDVFQRWLAEAQSAAGLSHPSAFCLSTVDEKGHPDARFVDLKEVGAQGFLFGTRLDSPKAQAIAQEPRVAMTFWWDQLERQVRIMGTANPASSEKADALFQSRSREARVVSVVSRQSHPLEDSDELNARVEQALGSGDPERPEYWGAFWVRPSRIEFLRFEESRLHERCVYVRREEGRWVKRWLHP